MFRQALWPVCAEAYMTLAQMGTDSHPPHLLPPSSAPHAALPQIRSPIAENRYPLQRIPGALTTLAGTGTFARALRQNLTGGNWREHCRVARDSRRIARRPLEPAALVPRRLLRPVRTADGRRTGCVRALLRRRFLRAGPGVEPGPRLLPRRRRVRFRGHHRGAAGLQRSARG